MGSRRSAKSPRPNLRPRRSGQSTWETTDSKFVLARPTIRPCAPLFINLKYLTIDFCKVLYYNREKKNSARFDGNKTADSRSGITERRAGGKEGIELCPHPDSPAEWKTR